MDWLREREREENHLTKKNRFGDPLILEQNRKTILMNFRFGLFRIDTRFFFIPLFLSKLVFFFLFLFLKKNILAKETSKKQYFVIINVTKSAILIETN